MCSIMSISGNCPPPPINFFNKWAVKRNRSCLGQIKDYTTLGFFGDYETRSLLSRKLTNGVWKCYENPLTNQDVMECGSNSWPYEGRKSVRSQVRPKPDGSHFGRCGLVFFFNGKKNSYWPHQQPVLNCHPTWETQENGLISQLHKQLMGWGTCFENGDQRLRRVMRSEGISGGITSIEKGGISGVVKRPYLDLARFYWYFTSHQLKLNGIIRGYTH